MKLARLLNRFFIDVFVDWMLMLFSQSLAKDPEDGFAKVHYGFIVKSVDHKYEDAIPYLREGINTNASGVIDGRFFFHLGDALHRTGKPDEVRRSPLQCSRHQSVSIRLWRCTRVAPSTGYSCPNGSGHSTMWTD